MTCAVGLGAAASASANEVTLWTCHAGDGTALGAPDGVATFGGGCATYGTGFDAGGMRFAPPGPSFSVTIPPSLTLKQLLLSRRVTGLGSAGSYSVVFNYTTTALVTTSHTSVLDASSVDVAGDVSPVAPAADPSGSLRFDIAGAGAALDLQRFGVKVDDAFDPTAAVGGIAPDGDVSGKVPVAVWANDAGAGLWKAALYVDGQKVGEVGYIDEKHEDAGRACVTTLDGQGPLPLDNDCLHHGEESIDFDSTTWPDGAHKATVKLYDASGRIAEPIKDRPFTVTNHPNLGNPSATLQIGSGNSGQQNGGNNGGNGGVAGESTTSCDSPRLSMELSQRPLRVSGGVPVLLSGKRYRFRGRLTCLIAGKRRSAPARTPIELLNTIGKRTYRKGGATVRAHGAITLILSYKSARTLVFRYTNPDGKRSQVKLKIKVAKRSR